ncbi:MAG: (d)CMP kinase [Proteobacteria bacterium]|nr:(d)CMP kinase [Pseudomonadota bacterium]
MSDCFVVAIDGPAGAGKSTTAKAVAEKLGFACLDSGALYRAVALLLVEAGADPSDERAVELLLAGARISQSADGEQTFLNDRNVTSLLRSARVSDAASRSSALPAVRSALIELQRAAARGEGLVVEGRDMGTVVFPRAALKVFLDADEDERARRRGLELGLSGTANLEKLGAEMAERDRRDRSRKVAPLRPAEDSLVLDTTSFSLQEVIDAVVKEVHSRKKFAK